MEALLFEQELAEGCDSVRPSFGLTDQQPSFRAQFCELALGVGDIESGMIVPGQQQCGVGQTNLRGRA
jgi:hypothetical protein